MNDSVSGTKGTLASIAHAAMIARGLQPDFSAEAINELKALAQAGAAGIPPPDEGVRDLRNLPWCSIDNDDSRDLDQLTVAGFDKSGAPAIFVAVADVDALVKRGGAIDAHASANTTSVYTAGGIFPMLPEQLSTDLTSLGEGVDRLAVVVEMTVGEDGTVKASQHYRALVRNQAKLAYDALAVWLEGGAMPPHLKAVLPSVPALEAQLRTQDKVAQALRGQRHQHGALNLQTNESRPVFNNDELMDLQPETSNRAKQLIEEFMVAANGATARFLDGHGYASLRRVLRSPERWARIVALAAGLSEKLPAVPDARALDAFLLKRRDANPDGFADLSLSVIKLLGRGEYAVQLPKQQGDGHFALAVQDYTHSTAPNRRFPDLVTLRVVKAALTGAPAPYSNKELDDLALHCTAQEDNAARVERQVGKSAAALLLTSRIGEQFDAIVTGVSDKGTWVRIEHPSTEGKLVSGVKGLEVANRLRVKLKHVDAERGFIDFVREDAK
jgi:exoribonuclease II